MKVAYLCCIPAGNVGRRRAAASLAVGMVALGLGAMLPVSAMAAAITGWSTDNVVVDAGPYTDDVTYFSTVYDRDVTGGTAGAVTNGRIAFTPPEATAPGLTVQTNPLTTGNCILASSGTTCDGPFQSGKRFKQQATDTGPIDLVFDVTNDDDNTAPYRVFHRLVNLTGAELAGFTVELGFGIGDGFVRSTAGDGLSFGLGNATIAASDDLVPFSQYPFGLFGDAAGNPNFAIDGFFSDARTGFNIAAATDLLASDGMYGPYADLFGDWLSQEDVPLGYFWDHDNDPTTDAILMAWINEDGLIEQRREEDGSEPVAITPIIVELGDLPDDYELLPIEDLANLNLNYLIFLDDRIFDESGQPTSTGNLAFSSFTLRVTTVAAVPEPASLALLGLGLVAVAAARRRR